MAIADGFEVWLRNVDAGLAEKHPGRTTREFEPLFLFRAYENGTPPSVFSAEPDAPLAPPKGWNARRFRPAAASGPIHWQLIGYLIILICIGLILDEGLDGGLMKYASLRNQSYETYTEGLRYPKGNPRRRLLMEQSDREMEMARQAGIHGLIYTMVPLLPIFLFSVLLATTVLNRYLLLNYKVGARLKRALAKVGIKPARPIFPDN